VQEVLHHVALAVAVLALGDAALRAASLAAPAGLERAIAAFVLAIATAVVEELALGVVGLGTSPVALVATTLAIWAGVRIWLPAPSVSPAGELSDWWTGLKRAWRVVGGAAAGFCGAWIVWQLLHPSLGFDSAVYHYPEVAGWIANGRPGSILELSYEIPYGNYPLTDEVAQTWGAAIARSWVPIALWNPTLLIVLTLAVWQTLRGLGAPRAAAALGAGTVVTLPLIVRQLNEPQTDLPALAWLACVAALALGAGRRPGLLVPAVVAAGLAIGTKTTAAPLALAALAAGAYLARGRLRPLAGPLALGAAVAVAVGGLWYARNVWQHGWPLWPFTEAPWGDPRPRFLALIETTFLDRPIATLDGRLDDYASRMGGGWLVLAGAVAVLVAALVTRLESSLRRSLVISAGLALLALLVWSLAWGTGLPRTDQLPAADGWPISTIRYMLPAMAMASVAVAIATRVGGRVGRMALVLLAGALVWNLVADARLGAPYAPRATTLLLGAVVGAGLVALLELARRRAPIRTRVRPQHSGAVAVAVAVVAGVLMVPVANGFIERHSKVAKSTSPGGEVVRWFLAQPGFEDGDATIAFAARAAFGALAGDRFEHRLELIPQRATCSDVQRRARRGPVLMIDPTWFEGILGLVSYETGRCLEGRPVAFREGSYAVYQPPGARRSRLTATDAGP
jgi:hypothetical protein